MKEAFTPLIALLILTCSPDIFAGEKKVTRLGESGGGLKKPAKKDSNISKRHGIGASGSHYLLMIMDYDKQTKTYLVVDKEGRRAVDKELAFERRYFSRILSEVKKEWQSDATTRHQRFPYLSSRRLSLRGTYRTTKEANEKLAAARDADARYEEKKRKAEDLRNNPNRQNKNNNRYNSNNKQKSQITYGKKRTIGRKTDEQKVTRLGNSSDGALGRVDGSDVVRWEPEKIMSEACERIRAKLAQYVTNQGPPPKD